MEKEEKKESPSKSIIEEYTKTIQTIQDYFSSELILPDQKDLDISYKNWISKDDNLKKLSSIIRVSNILEDSQHIYETHDHDCEHKLIKWITEDKDHKDKFVKVPKTIIKVNRDSNILPYQYNAVTTDGQPFRDESNYINASFISGPFLDEGDKNMFIATQAPLPDTIYSFWSMIKTNQVPLIIMLTNLAEEGRTKSESYWPNELNEEKIVTNGENKISVVLTELVNSPEEHKIRRRFVVDNSFQLEQVQILNWPDHSAPTQIEKFDSIQYLIDVIGYYINLPERLPILIHCSAGVGRTGTFIALFNIIRCLQKLIEFRIQGEVKETIVPFFNVFNVVRKLREQRYSMVSDKAQYKFIYSYILDWIKNNFK